MKLSSLQQIYKDKYVLYIYTRVAPKVMPLAYFPGNYNRYRKYNKSKFLATYFILCIHKYHLVVLFLQM